MDLRAYEGPNGKLHAGSFMFLRNIGIAGQPQLFYGCFPRWTLLICSDTSYFPSSCSFLSSSRCMSRAIPSITMELEAPGIKHH